MPLSLLRPNSSDGGDASEGVHVREQRSGSSGIVRAGGGGGGSEEAARGKASAVTGDSEAKGDGDGGDDRATGPPTATDAVTAMAGKRALSDKDEDKRSGGKSEVDFASSEGTATTTSISSGDAGSSGNGYASHSGEDQGEDQDNDDNDDNDDDLASNASNYFDVAAEELFTPARDLQVSWQDYNDRVESFVMQSLDRIVSTAGGSRDKEDNAADLADTPLALALAHAGQQGNSHAEHDHTFLITERSAPVISSAAPHHTDHIPAPRPHHKRPLADDDSTLLRRTISSSSLGGRLRDKISEFRGKGDDFMLNVNQAVTQEKLRLKALIAKHKESIRERQAELANQQAKVKADLLRRRQILEERMKKPPFLRLIDKLCFLGSILSLFFVEFIILQHPQWLWVFYTISIVPLVAIRYVMYHKEKWHYFLLDFCYFSNCLLLFYLYLYPNSPVLFAIIFGCSNGPLAWSIVAWRNSLVFHDIDKMTSCAIHILPALVTYTLRWFPEGGTFENVCESESCSLSFHAWLIAPLVTYIMWQLSYFMKTEYVDHAKMVADARIKTSFRYLSNSRSHIVFRIMSKYNRKLWPYIFMGVQLLYTVLTLLPIKLLFGYFFLHTGFLMLIILVAVWNGANYYTAFLFQRSVFAPKAAAPVAAAASPSAPAEAPLS